MFADGATKNRANRFAEEWERFQHGLAVVESKRWLRLMDRRSGRRGEESAPSTRDRLTGKYRYRGLPHDGDHGGQRAITGCRFDQATGG